ncbi:hypothetical protein [Streptomyces sp. CB01580]|uniref:hypothetical protein n=1 Tax=Streptomyces sp. CB01580 TaxID=1703933 RepID=UPI0009391241|nr:hypothetical protein [Streptomyces sp. CB01580]OKJ35032.1 hypothetical protein AMK22_17495 [Streptomyces sp. CB01580]
MLDRPRSELPNWGLWTCEAAARSPLESTTSPPHQPLLEAVIAGHADGAQDLVGAAHIFYFEAAVRTVL